ncbi:TetR family transcriptional regulator [Nocardioides sp. B-3]|uniref:TetR family transcriptional regulator n=1 Tax=Nocardioides sp. B-3 TaxID=2895565 RepID=UPI0021536E5A|nr:TetR family transcriptional regulator [Nocardioides sp. B-3]UUZ58332.1 TetR family transcriptional regulator [Nocardioides sp. B-3]
MSLAGCALVVNAGARDPHHLVNTRALNRLVYDRGHGRSERGDRDPRGAQGAHPTRDPDAALELTEGTSLVAISLRRVAKEVGIVPTAFYRHFDSVESPGLAPVDESFESLRGLLREVWLRSPEFRDYIDGSLPVLADHVRAHRVHYAFIARERTAGPPRVRDAIRHEIELITRELATDVARLPDSAAFSSEHLNLLADLIVSFVVTTAERLIEAPEAEARIPGRDPHPAADADGGRPELEVAPLGPGASGWDAARPDGR